MAALSCSTMRLSGTSTGCASPEPPRQVPSEQVLHNGDLIGRSHCWRRSCQL
jgi:hypothetical protein